MKESEAENEEKLRDKNKREVGRAEDRGKNKMDNAVGKGKAGKRTLEGE